MANKTCCRYSRRCWGWARWQSACGTFFKVQQGFWSSFDCTAKLGLDALSMVQNLPPRLNLKEYSDYRIFLRDYVHYRKSQARGWSLSTWKHQLGLSSAATLSMVISGHRHPGKKLTRSLVKYFGFNEGQSRYFEKLVDLQKRYQKPQMALFLTKGKDPLQLHENEAPKPILNEEVVDLLLKPVTHILREMTMVEGFTPSAEWIVQHLIPKYSVVEIKKHLQKLIKNELLAIDNGKWVAVPTNVQPTKPSAEKVLKLHSEVLKTTSERLSELDESERSFHLSYLNVKSENMGLAKRLIREFQAEFNKLVEEKPGDRVYQLSIQFIPVTHNGESNSQNS